MIFQFETLTSFLLMDGHGLYVWSCYLITGIAMKLLILFPLIKRKSLIVQLKRQKRLEENQAKTQSREV